MEFSQFSEIQKEIIKVLVKYPNRTLLELSISLDKDYQPLTENLKFLMEKQIVFRSENKPYKYFLNKLFLEENPIFKLSDMEVEVLKFIIQNHQIEKKELAKQMNISLYVLDGYITTLNNQHFITIKKENKENYLSVTEEFIQNTPSFLSKEEQSLLFTLTEYSMTDLYELILLLKASGEQIQELLNNLANYHFIFSQNVNGVEKWQVRKSSKLDFLFRNKKREEKRTNQNTSKISEQINQGMDYHPDNQLPILQKEILYKIIKQPGLLRKDLLASLGIAETTLCNRLRRLLNQHYIIPIKFGRNICYYVNKKFIEDNPNFLIDFENEQKIIKNKDGIEKEELNKLLEQERKKEKQDYNHSYQLTNDEKEILCIIIQNPNLSHIDLATSLNILAISLTQKLKGLIRNHFIQYFFFAKKKFYYINNSFIEENPTFVTDFQKEKWEFGEYNHNYKLTKEEQKTLQTIIQNPGLPQKELATLLNLKPSALSNRVLKLKKNHFIQGIKRGRNICYYANNHFIEEKPNVEAYIQKKKEERNVSMKDLLEKKKSKEIDYNHSYQLTEAEQKTLQMIIQNSGLPQKELANSLNLNPSALCNRLKLLRENHFIQGIKMGKYVYYIANDKFIEDYPNFPIDFEKQNLETKEESSNLLEQKRKEILSLKEEYNRKYPLNETEKKTLWEVVQNPGLSHKELANSLNLSPSALYNRLKLLKENHFVHQLKFGKNAYYYINKRFLEENPNFEEEQRNPSIVENIGYKLTRKEKIIFQKITETPNLSTKELGTLLNMNTPALCNKLKRLKDLHLIQCVRNGKNAYYSPDDKIMENHPNGIWKKPIYSNQESLLLLLVKNILILSPSKDAEILFNNFEFFQYCFSLYEFIHLLLLLDICKLDKDDFSSLLQKEKFEKEKNSDKVGLLLRYQEACFYLNNRYENQNISSSPKVKTFSFDK